MQRPQPFIEPCLPTLAKEPPAGPAWVHEVKFDDYRLQLHKDGKDVVPAGCASKGLMNG